MGTVKTSPLARRISSTIATVVVIVFCAVAPCVAQTSSQDRPADWHFSFELFQMLLEENGLKTVVDFNELGPDPRDCLIVSVGNVGNITSRNIQRFTGTGGAVFLASDQEQSIAGICNFRSGPVIAELAFDHAAELFVVGSREIEGVELEVVGEITAEQINNVANAA